MYLCVFLIGAVAAAADAWANIECFKLNSNKFHIFFPYIRVRICARVRMSNRIRTSIEWHRCNRHPSKWQIRIKKYKIKRS